MENTFDQPIIPANESERLEELRRLNLFATYEEFGTFKHIAAIASRMFAVPIAIVNIVEEYHVITLAGVGVEPGTEVPREISLCSLAILSNHATIFQNAPDEPCLLANPLVHGSFGLQFYAAAPLKTRKGIRLGALCIVDKEPRKFSESDQRILETLAAIIMSEIEK